MHPKLVQSGRHSRTGPWKQISHGRTSGRLHYCQERPGRMGRPVAAPLQDNSITSGHQVRHLRLPSDRVHLRRPCSLADVKNDSVIVDPTPDMILYDDLSTATTTTTTTSAGFCCPAGKCRLSRTYPNVLSIPSSFPRSFAVPRKTFSLHRLSSYHRYSPSLCRSRRARRFQGAAL